MEESGEVLGPRTLESPAGWVFGASLGLYVPPFELAADAGLGEELPRIPCRGLALVELNVTYPPGVAGFPRERIGSPRSWLPLACCTILR